MQVIHEWCWWKIGKCVVKVVGAGHFPTTVMVILPNDKQTEVEIKDLEGHDENGIKSS